MIDVTDAEMFGDRSRLLAATPTTRGQVNFYPTTLGYGWEIMDGPYRSRGARRTVQELGIVIDDIKGYIESPDFDHVVRAVHPKRFGE